MSGKKDDSDKCVPKSGGGKSDKDKAKSKEKDKGKDKGKKPAEPEQTCYEKCSGLPDWTKNLVYAIPLIIAAPFITRYVRCRQCPQTKTPKKRPPPKKSSKDACCPPCCCPPPEKKPACKPPPRNCD